MLAHAWTVNAPTIAQLAPVIGASLARGGVLHTFGSGHSELISREIIGRAGGLVCISGVIDPTAGFIENLVGYGTRLIERYDRQHQLFPGETIIVISNSGKNSSPIEVAGANGFRRNAAQPAERTAVVASTCATTIATIVSVSP